MEIAIPLLCIALIVNAVMWLIKVRQKPLPPQKIEVPPPQVNVNLRPLEDKITELPNKVLQSIINSANTHKGALGELIGYLQLHAQYDRIIPIGNIVDFICIKLPDATTEGHIDFVDIKTGNRCRLSKDQKALQKLITDKQINFIKLKVETSENKS